MSTHKNKFIMLGDDLWHIDHIKRIKCNDEVCECEISAYHSDHLDRGRRNGDRTIKYTKAKHPNIYQSLKNIYGS